MVHQWVTVTVHSPLAIDKMQPVFVRSSSGGRSCCQCTKCSLPQNLWHCAIEWSVIVNCPKHTCAVILLFDQHLDLPHL